MKINPALAILLLSAFAGCSGGNGSTRNANSSDEAVPRAVSGDAHPEMRASLDGNVVRFTMTVGTSSASSTARTVQSIAAFRAVIRRANGSTIDSLVTTDIPSSGQKNTETDVVTSTRYASIEWNREGNTAPGTSADLALLDAYGTVLATQHILFDTLSASPVGSKQRRSLDLDLDVRAMGPGVEFTVTATRRAPPPDGEYLPSGEQYRIEVTTQIGEMIWSTNEGRAFTQQIGTVEPTTVGSRVNYRTYWDGRDPRTRKSASPGRYRVLVTIPARPTPYTLQEEIQLGGDK